MENKLNRDSMVRICNTMRNKVILVLSLLLTFSTLVAKATSHGNSDARVTEQATQQSGKRVTGQVTDNNGEPIIGASVVVKGKTTGGITNADGMFTLDGIREGSVLVISYLGFNSQEVSVGKQSNFNVVLSPDAKSLDEVVVVAYGTQKKATLTGSVAAISTKEIKQSPTANLAVTLTGRLPGLSVIQRSGEPGRDNTLLYLRGRGTINGQNPLIMVDGVERELTSIDPNEVENISILKDASSTALFGVRGANGVILVTTKRGTSEIPDISFSAETGWQTFTRWPSELRAYDWALLKNQAWHNDNPNPGPLENPPYSDNALERYRLGDKPEVYGDHNWIKMLMHKWVPQTRYNLTLNGKGLNVAYFVNVGYLNQGGQFKLDNSEKRSYDAKNYMDRFNFRANIDVALNARKTLKAFLNAAGVYEKVNGPNMNSTAVIEQLLTKWPVILPGPLTPAGQVLVGGSSYQESPWAQINRSGYKNETRSSITATFGMQYDLDSMVKGLSLKAVASYDSKTFNNLVGQRSYQYWEQVITKDAHGKDVISYNRIRSDFDNTPISTSKYAEFASFYDVQFQILYNRVFNQKHSLNGLLMAQQQSQIRRYQVLPYNVNGFAARLVYGYDDRYIAEFDAGYNGSEQFAPANRYGFFPSISGAWNVYNEQFFKKSSIAKTIDKLKLRLSYGIVGNDKLGDERFLYLDNTMRTGSGYSSSISNNHSIAESFFGNPNLKWETAKKINFGFEIGLLQSLNLTVDLFSERRENILIKKQTTPGLVGVPLGTLPPFNLGKVKNQGYEIELNYTKAINKDLLVMLKGNFNYNDNEVIDIDELQYDETYAYRYRSTGYMIGQQWGLKADGYFKDQAEIAGYAKYDGIQPRPGDLKFVDVNGDNKIDNKDMVPIGYSDVPKYTWGTALSITYKWFDISALLQGTFKVSGPILGTGPWEWYDFRSFHQDAWTKERAEKGEKITFPALAKNQSASEFRHSDYFNMDRSYVRLKNLEIGFTFPQAWSKVINAKKIRIYANGYNLITWDKMKFDDWDPEVIANNTYPVLKIVNIGANITF
jgi:tonB-linked outer membrane protein, susC/ragA family